MLYLLVAIGHYRQLARIDQELAQSMEAAIRENVPPKTIDLNLKAFRKGLEIGGKAPIEEPVSHATA